MGEISAFRNFIALAFVSLFCFKYSYGLVNAAKRPTLEQTKQSVQEINGYKTYNVVTIDGSEEFLGHGTDNGGYLKGYYKGDSLKKIFEWAREGKAARRSRFFGVK